MRGPREIWDRLRGWRRIRFTRSGVMFVVAALAVGFAAVNTGNNLLHLLLGAMLGLLVVSGWLSERAIRSLEVSRRTPGGTFVDREVRIHYRVRNTGSRMAGMLVEVEEEGLPGRAFLARIPPGEDSEAKTSKLFVQRGVYPLSTVILSTTWPFGLFRRERDLRLRGELVIWPRIDRPVERAPLSGSTRFGTAQRSSRRAGPRGEYRNLREYRVGDDARDIHWRRSAGLEHPVVREYERESGEAFWICLDTSAPAGPAAEECVEVAAAMAARATAEARRYGLVAGDRFVAPGSGPAHLESVLDALARTDFAPDNPPAAPPPDPFRSILVSTTDRGRATFGESWIVGDDGAPPARAGAVT